MKDEISMIAAEKIIILYCRCSENNYYLHLHNIYIYCKLISIGIDEEIKERTLS